MSLSPLPTQEEMTGMVGCPACHAKPGDPCRTGRGAETRNHMARQDAAVRKRRKQVQG